MIEKIKDVFEATLIVTMILTGVVAVVSAIFTFYGVILWCVQQAFNYFAVEMGHRETSIFAAAVVFIMLYMFFIFLNRLMYAVRRIF